MVQTTPTATYPQFGDAEVGRRKDLVRSFLEQSGLDGLVVFGWSAQNRAAQADVYYLSGYMGMRDNYVIFPRDGEPALFAQSYNHVPNAADVSFLEDVRWGGVDNGMTVGTDLLDRGLVEVGVVGWMPYQQYDSMRRTTGERCRFTDVTAGFRKIRLKKSHEELDWLRRGAGYTDAALAALRDALTPGIREFELAPSRARIWAMAV
jgi:Xaa-Pro aminopeptidase